MAMARPGPIRHASRDTFSRKREKGATADIPADPDR